MAEDDPYVVLGLEPRPGLTDGEIKKAYRRKALKLHPDKRAASERDRAQKEFDALQKAYDVLLDPEARAALENLARARAASRVRDEAQDAKRRKMREDLERRERRAAAGKTEEEEAKERLRVELARLRRDFKTRKRAYDAETAAERASASASTAAPAPAAPASPPEHLFRTVKVAWRRDAGDYPVHKLRDVYAKLGAVEDIVIRDGKKKKGSALVVFADERAAERAARAAAGDPANPLLAVRAATRGAAHSCASGDGGARGAGGPGGSRAGGGADGVPTGEGGGAVPGASSGGNVANRDYESVVLANMRRAEERARLVAEMEKEEAEEDGVPT